MEARCSRSTFARASASGNYPETFDLAVEAGGLLDAWMFDVVPGKPALILAHAFQLVTSPSLQVPNEHSEVKFVSPRHTAALTLPDRYRAAIAHACVAQARGKE